jgi:hypothetical protein
MLSRFCFKNIIVYISCMHVCTLNHDGFVQILKRILRAQDCTFALFTSTEIFLSYFDHDLEIESEY